ncbi:MAG: type 2 isopentenyl-diphosphate Delta-isomerase [Persicimonas sp.]
MDDDQQPDISQRKLDHIDLCAEEEVEYRGKTTLLDEVELLHDSLPELSVDGIDLGVEVFGKRLEAPLLITGMTGGAERAREINLTLARVAQQLGIAFGVGSQRALLEQPELADTYQVREVAPDILLFGNVGAVQVAESSTAEIEGLVDAIGADALCVHLNPGQEMIQPEGDRDFRGCVDGIARLVEELSVPVIAKETGCGLGPRALDRLRDAGVPWVDTSGAGGTTWVGVETLRTSPEKATIGEMFWDWGVPTGAAICYGKSRGFNVIGSGGLRTGLDAARAVALGADLAGMALPWLKAAYNEGFEAALQFGQTTKQALRVACLLTGSKNTEALQEAPRVLGPNLQRWLDNDHS